MRCVKHSTDCGFCNNLWVVEQASDYIVVLNHLMGRRVLFERVIANVSLKYFLQTLSPIK